VFGLVVRFDLKPGTGEAFDALAGKAVSLIQTSEPGTLIYACHSVEGGPNARVFYELYRDRIAFEEHERQPHIRHFLEERQRHLAGPPRVEFLALQAGKGTPGSEVQGT
jgi:quinol monooxygenase YgiN